MKEWIRIKDGWQTPVPDELLNADLSKGAKLLWICLKSFASKTSPQPFPSRFTLCKMLGGKKPCNKESFYAYRQELIDSHYLEPENQMHRDRGQWGSRCYTLGLPDNKSKQCSSPCLEKPDTVKPDTVKPYPVNPDTKSTTSVRVPRLNNTTNKGSAGADDVVGGDNSKTSANADVGKCFTSLWCLKYQEWFGQAYLPKPGESKKAEEVIKSLKCKPRDVIAYALRMWINTEELDMVKTEGFDPEWYQIKGSRDLRFFLNNLSKIAEEQKKPFELAIPVPDNKYRQLEEFISSGRN